MDVSLREQAATWNLNCNKQLLNTLQTMHQKVTTKSAEIKDKIECLVSSVTVAGLSLGNSENAFKERHGRQYVESRVQEDDTDIACSVTPKKEEIKPVKKPKKTDSKAMEVLKKYHEEIPYFDSDDSSSDEECNKPRIILRIKNMYTERPLPYIIGSEKWRNKRHGGLIAEDSDDSTKGDKSDESVYSDTDEEVETKKTTKPANTKPIVADTSTTEKAKVDKPMPQKTIVPKSAPVVNEKTMPTEEDTSTIENAKVNNPMPQKPIVPKIVPVVDDKTTPSQISQSALAAELASRLSGKLIPAIVPTENTEPLVPKENKENIKRTITYKKEQSEIVPGHIFANDPPPLTQSDDDDIFAGMHKPDSNQKADINDLFNEDSNDFDVFQNVFPVAGGSSGAIAGDRPWNNDDKNKKPAGAVPLSSSTYHPYPEVLQNVNENSTRSSEALVKVAEPNKKFILNDDIFDDVDDLFSTDFISKPKPKTSKKLFDDDDDALFSEIIDESKKDAHENKQINEGKIINELSSEKAPTTVVTKVEVKGNASPVNNLPSQQHLTTSLLDEIMPISEPLDDNSKRVENKTNAIIGGIGGNTPSDSGNLLNQKPVGISQTYDKNISKSHVKNDLLKDATAESSEATDSARPCNNDDKNKKPAGTVPLFGSKMENDSVAKSIRNRYRKHSSSSDDDIMDVYKSDLQSDEQKSSYLSHEIKPNNINDDLTRSSEALVHVNEPIVDAKKNIASDDIFEDVDDLLYFLPKSKQVPFNLFEKDDALFSESKKDVGENEQINKEKTNVLSREKSHFKQSVETKIVNNLKETKICSVIDDEVDCIFRDQPSKMKASNDNETSKDVYARFGNDSEANLRKGTSLSELLSDEPPLLIPDQNVQLDDNKKEKYTEIRRSDISEKTPIGKIKSSINIDVNALLPGSKLVKTKSDFEKRIDIPKTSSNLEDYRKNVIATNNVKSSTFEDRETPILCNKKSKERAKIQVKRRPSSRKARKNAISNSGTFLDDQTADRNVIISNDHVNSGQFMDISVDTSENICTGEKLESMTVEDETSTEVTTTFEDSQQEKSEILSSDDELNLVADKSESTNVSKDLDPPGQTNNISNSDPEDKYDEIFKTFIKGLGDDSSDDELIIKSSRNTLKRILKSRTSVADITTKNEDVKRGAIPKNMSHNKIYHEIRHLHKSSDSEEGSDCDPLCSGSSAKNKLKRHLSSEQRKKDATTSDLDNLKDKDRKLAHVFQDNPIKTIGEVYADTKVNLDNKDHLYVQSTQVEPQLKGSEFSFSDGSNDKLGMGNDSYKTNTENVPENCDQQVNKGIEQVTNDSDDDIFTTFAQKNNDSSDDELIFKSSPNTLTRIVKSNNNITAGNKEPTKEQKISVFDSSSDEEIFGAKKLKTEDIFSKNTDKASVYKAINEKSLFNDDGDKELFEKSSKLPQSSTSVPAKTDSKAITSAATSIEQVFDDPLGACKQFEEEEQFF